MIEELKLAISENNKEKARRILMNDLLGTDYPHEVFRDAIDLASEYEIFEQHDKKKLKSNPKTWDEEYLQELITKLEQNFSKERFLATYYVTRKLEKDEKVDALEERCAIRVYDKYKKFFVMAEVGAAVAGVAVISLGLFLYNKKGKK